MNSSFEREQEEDRDQSDNSEKSLVQLDLDKAQEYCLEAHCLLNGHAIGQQIDDAIHWYNKSKDAGEPKAMLALAQMTEKGIGVRIDMSDAQEYYQRAADLGEPIS